MITVKTSISLIKISLIKINGNNTNKSKTKILRKVRTMIIVLADQKSILV